MINKAIILAGGKGTRMLPYTKACPKELLPLGDKPALHYIVKEAADAGVKQVLIVVNPEKNSIIKYFSYDEALDKELALQGKSELLRDLDDLIGRVDISFITQYDADGTGGALLLTEEFASGEPVLVMNGDDIMTGGVAKQIVDVFDKRQKTVLAVSNVSDEEIRNCGSVRIVKKDGREMAIDDIIEKPAVGQEYSMYASQGRYVFPNKFYDYMKGLKRGKNNEIILTDALAQIARDEGAYAYDFMGKRYDLGSKAGYLEAEIDIALQDKSLGEEVKKLLLKYRG